MPQSPASALLLGAAGVLALFAAFEALDGVRYHVWHITFSLAGAAAALGLRAWIQSRERAALG